MNPIILLEEKLVLTYGCNNIIYLCHVLVKTSSTHFIIKGKIK